MGLTCKDLKVPAKPLFISVWTRPTASSITRIGQNMPDCLVWGQSLALNEAPKTLYLRGFTWLKDYLPSELPA
jgi:hypothetical protein